MFQPQIIKIFIEPFFRKRNGTIYFQIKRKSHHFLYPFKRQGQFLWNPCNLPPDYIYSCLSNKVSPTFMVPSFNGTKPITAFSNEVFPQPDCPTIQAVFPLSRFRFNPEKSTSVPKAIQALLICSMAFSILSFRQR